MTNNINISVDIQKNNKCKSTYNSSSERNNSVRTNNSVETKFQQIRKRNLDKKRECGRKIAGKHISIVLNTKDTDHGEDIDIKISNRDEVVCQNRKQYTKNSKVETSSMIRSFLDKQKKLHAGYFGAQKKSVSPKVAKKFNFVKNNLNIEEGSNTEKGKNKVAGRDNASHYDAKQSVATTKHIINQNFSLKYKIGKYGNESKKNKADKHHNNIQLPSDFVNKTTVHQNISLDKNNCFNVEEQKDDLHNNPKSNKISKIKNNKDHLKINLSILDKRLDYIMNCSHIKDTKHISQKKNSQNLRLNNSDTIEFESPDKLSAKYINKLPYRKVINTLEAKRNSLNHTQRKPRFNSLQK